MCPFFDAVAFGELETVRAYLDLFGPQVLALLAVSWEGWSGQWMASWETGLEPLHVACGHGHLEVAQLLHEWGANVHAKTTSGASPMHFACQAGRLDVARWLHAQGASIDEPTRTDALFLRPLHLACQANAPDLVAWLLNHGANPNARDALGHRPGDYALVLASMDPVVV